MRKINVDQVMTGAKLAKSIFTSEGKILLTAGVKLKDSNLKRIINSGISAIYVEDEVSSGVQIQGVNCEETRMQVQQLVESLIEGYSFSSSINKSKAKDIILKTVNEIICEREILENLYSLKTVDDYTFGHSINVCILSLIMGVGLGYNLLRLRDLGIGAILHDIGKMRIPEEILKKPSKLTVEEFEEIKKHTTYGYDILKKNKNVSMISSFIAIGHHERYDGSGYPLQIKGENIHQCARIVAVADVFDALSSDRVYRKKMKLGEVFEYIVSLGLRHFDQEIVDSFMSFMSVYPAGSGVILNTRERALVVDVNKRTPTKPVVRVVFDAKGKKLKKQYEIDLTQKEDVFIEDVCEL